MDDIPWEKIRDLYEAFRESLIGGVAHSLSIEPCHRHAVIIKVWDADQKMLVISVDMVLLANANMSGREHGSNLAESFNRRLRERKNHE